MKIHFKFLTIFLLLLSFTAFADDVAFTRYIQKGDKGPDVLLLQKVLNSASSTQITASGIGAPGNETDYYGELTKQAVIKLQKANNLGTTYGIFTLYSGALDDKTRDFLNKDVADKGGAGFFLTTNNSSDTCGQINNANDIASKTAGLGKILDPLSTSSIEERTKAFNTISGIQRTSTSTPYIKSVVLENKPGSTLPGPSLSSPFSFQSGGKIKIIGCNFATSTDNTVHMMYNDQKVKSTDGKTLEFTPKSNLQDMFSSISKDIQSKTIGNLQKFLTLPGVGGNNSSSSGQQMPGTPFFITIENDKGISNTYQFFFNFQ